MLKRLTICGVCLCVLCLAMPAQASHIRGVKATVTNLDVPTLTADMDVTMYTIHTATVSQSTALGFTTFGFPAVRWGDGATLSHSTIPAVAAGPPAVFRGSFSHSYAGVGPYTVTVATTCCATYASTGTITGNRVSAEVGDIFTNTTTVDFTAVPAVNWKALAALAVLMVLAGIYLLKR